MKIKVGSTTIETDLMTGYRRVTSGYTLKGDLIYVPAKDRNPSMPLEWEEIEDGERVSAFFCVIRPKAGA